MFTAWKQKKTYKSRPLRIRAHGGGVEDRQSKIPGFSQEALSRVTALCAGAGGLGSHIGECLARKGVGELILCDEDAVEPSNLNRQKFYRRDLWKNKAIRLAKNQAAESFLGTVVTGIALNFAEAVESGLVGRFDCIISGIDDELAREGIADYALAAGIPLITTAVSGNGDSGYVHVQKPGEACWRCAFPREWKLRDDLANYRAPCPGTPAIKDILMLVAGAAGYALDALFMDRPIAWNYREFHLAGFMPDVVRRVERLPSCCMCGSAANKEGASVSPTRNLITRSRPGSEEMNLKVDGKTDYVVDVQTLQAELIHRGSQLKMTGWGVGESGTMGLWSERNPSTGGVR
ncbi:MAG: ThiF family adenylyltransferase [Planctomycetota bacterium]|nr:ThiF family adenylyltransferase [Planctomycetota bacterium]